MPANSSKSSESLRSSSRTIEMVQGTIQQVRSNLNGRNESTIQKVIMIRLALMKTKSTQKGT